MTESRNTTPIARGATPVPVSDDFTDVMHCPEVPEVALILWILLSAPKFKLRDFSLGALESGLRSPGGSEVMSVVHTNLLMTDKELIQARKESRVNGAVRREFEWWTKRLADTVRKWVDTRRGLAYDVQVMQSDEYEGEYDEANIQWHNDNIEELDELLNPVLLGEIPDMEEIEVEEEEEDEEEGANKMKKPEQAQEGVKEEPMANEEAPRKLTVAERLEERKKAQEAFEEEAILKILPFDGPESYMTLTPLARLMLLRSVVAWRANGQPDDITCTSFGV